MDNTLGNKSATRVGTNRTGIDASPVDSQDIIAEAKARKPSFPDDDSQMNQFRKTFIGEADRIGSVPPPGTLKGVAAVGAQKLMGKQPEALIDKLAERLAFERTGTRLYDAFLTKCESLGTVLPGVTLDQLREFRNEEFKHFGWVAEALRMIGADPTAMPPAADVAGMASVGLVQVITDPRTSVSQSLHAVLIAELADNDGWNVLIRLCEEMGLKETADRFRTALAEEDKHLMVIRQVYKALVMQEAKVEKAA